MLRLVELFAGIGAQAQALTDLGIPYTSTVCEIDDRAYDAYVAIHGPTPNLGDIRNVRHLPDCDLLTYSFPCQDLSISGLQKGMSEGSGTRSSLLWEVGRLLRDAVEREREPEVLVMENVDAILNEGNLVEFTRWIETLKALGYTSVHKVLNAKDYGVPQSRRRCFMVSMTGGRRFRFPEACPDGRILADVLEDEPDESVYLSDEQVQVYEAHRKRHEDAGHGFGWRPSEPVADAHALTTKPDRPSQNFIILRGRLNRPGFHDQINRVYGEDGISPCLTACRGGSHMPKIEDGDRIRMLTPRECWRLQGFPDDAYDRASAGASKTTLYRLAGNSIAVPCLVAIFRAIYIARAWTVERTLEDFA